MEWYLLAERGVQGEVGYGALLHDLPALVVCRVSCAAYNIKPRVLYISPSFLFAETVLDKCRAHLVRLNYLSCHTSAHMRSKRPRHIPGPQPFQTWLLESPSSFLSPAFISTFDTPTQLMFGLGLCPFGTLSCFLVLCTSCFVSNIAFRHRYARSTAE